MPAKKLSMKQIMYRTEVLIRIKFLKAHIRSKINNANGEKAFLYSDEHINQVICSIAWYMGVMKKYTLYLKFINHCKDLNLIERI